MNHTYGSKAVWTYKIKVLLQALYLHRKIDSGIIFFAHLIEGHLSKAGLKPICENLPNFALHLKGTLVPAATELPFEDFLQYKRNKALLKT